MNDIVIDSNVPIPSPKSNLTNVMRELNPGDSFLINIEERSKLPQIAKNIKIKILTRQTEDKTKVRVWRVK